jgi:outer membrane receptor protein involved in Fe transport
VGESRGTDGALTSFGVDVRDVRGETREESAFVDGAFTRRRFAGGQQTNAGVFTMHSHSLSESLRGALGLRVDSWQDTDGHRRDYLNDAEVGNERFAKRDGVALSPSAGLVWRANEAIRLHVSGQHAFRRPTLNELYRPFRVGNVITEANPNLQTETVTSGEIGAVLTQGAFEFGATAFRNELNDAVANVTVGSGPGVVPGVGFVPAGGEGRRRLNLDESVVKGVALSAKWHLSESLSADAQYLYNDATVTEANIAPALEGLRLAQVPRHSASAGLVWIAGRWSISPRVRFMGEQFEDDTNTLRLASATIIDLSISTKVGQFAEIFVSAENLLDERIETGRSSSGLVNVGMPRMLLVGFRLMR